MPHSQFSCKKLLLACSKQVIQRYGEQTLWRWHDEVLNWLQWGFFDTASTLLKPQEGFWIMVSNSANTSNVFFKRNASERSLISVGFQQRKEARLMLLPAICSLQGHLLSQHIFRSNCVKSCFSIFCVRGWGFTVLSVTVHPEMVGDFRLFIVANGCPSQRRPQNMVSCYGDSARIQDETTENSFKECLAYSTFTRDLGLTSHPKNY